MPMELLDLEIEEVSSVERAANNRRFLVIKRATGIGKQDEDDGCTCTDDEKDDDCPVHGAMHKNDDVMCDDDECEDADCPVHGTAAKNKRVDKGPVDAMGSHPEPDGDEEPPLDYASRGKQYDLWECLWGDWECFCATFYDVVGDGDSDNIPHLPILLRSIDQFKADVEDELAGLGLTEKMAPALADLTAIAKAGAAMAGHRLKRFQDALAALQAILDECTPEDLPHGIQPPIDRAGISAAQAAGIPGYMKGARRMATDAEKAELDGLRKRADAAEARVAELEPLAARVAEHEGTIAKLESTIAKIQQTPEEQIAAYWASQPEAVRKAHEADEAEKVELRKQLAEERSEREQTVYITKTADFRGFGMVSKHWRILKAIDAIPDQEDREELLRLMKASSERDTASDIYKAVGSEGRYGTNGTVESSSANDQIITMTESYAQEHECSFAVASEKIAKAHPDLYRRAADERRRSSRVSSE